MNNVHRPVRARAALTLTLLAACFAAGAQQRPQLTDPEIASAAVTANQIDVNYGKIALARSKNAEVRKFAQTMVTDHSGVIKQAAALAEKLHLTPRAGALTQKLLDGASATEKKLRAAAPAAFDKTYVDNEVAYHTAVITAVDSLLIPETDNAELKTLLEKVAPVLTEHLAHAKMLQASLTR